MKIAVTGKGGVGKTTIAATLALLYAHEGRKVIAADADVIDADWSGVSPFEYSAGATAEIARIKARIEGSL